MRFLCVSLFCLCLGFYKSVTKKISEIKIRHLNCDYLNQPGLYSELSSLKIYAVETQKDTADLELIAKIDSFVCERFKDSIHLEKGNELILRFLKETDETRKLVDTRIEETHNPISSEHFVFVQYVFSKEHYFYKSINNISSNLFNSLPCLK